MKYEMEKPFPTWTLRNENAILTMIAKQGFASVQAEVKRHIEENAMGSATQGFWIDVNRYLIAWVPLARMIERLAKKSTCLYKGD